VNNRVGYSQKPLKTKRAETTHRGMD